MGNVPLPFDPPPRTGIPRLRMFAGPNGSGKSTIKAQVEERLWGYYINPDEIEAQISRTYFFNFERFGLEVEADQVLPFFTGSEWLQKVGRGGAVKALTFRRNCLDFSGVAVDSYLASVLADFLRKQLLEQRADFTFETVMSARDKVELLSHAQSLGYRTYLYYVCTDDVRININRVQNRVDGGGHSVPEDKIRQRYERSLGLLLEAIRNSNRTYLFDNSGEKAVCFADAEDGELTIRSAPQPNWFATHVLKQVPPAE